MKARGAYRVTRAMLAKRLGISPFIYKVEIASTGEVIFYCYSAQDSYETPEGHEPPMVKIEDPRFY